MTSRLFVLLTALMLLLGPLAASVAAQEVPELKINSKRYIVIDAETGEVFAQRNANEQAAMASLTKVFTAIEAIEAAGPGYQITTTEADLVSADNSMMGFDAGETFTLEELLHGLMLPSGNDAANAIARALGGEPGDTAEQARQRFIDRMNTRIANMGLTDTHLVNPSGWGVPDHYSSARDLAVFVMYALQYPRFVQLISTLDYETANGGYQLRNNNRLLTMYPSLLGGKTGFDYDAGWCLIEVARRDGSTMISVTMDGIYPDDWYDDNRVLLEYAFEQKEKRLAAQAPIAGEIVSFRDPDAATIARIATSDASLAVPPAAVAAAQAPGATDDAVSSPGLRAARATGSAPDTAATSPTRVRGQITPNWQLAAATIVAASIVLGRMLFSFLQPAGARRVAPGGQRPRRMGWPPLALPLTLLRREGDTRI